MRRHEQKFESMDRIIKRELDKAAVAAAERIDTMGKTIKVKLPGAKGVFAPGKSGALTSGESWLSYIWHIPVSAFKAMARRLWVAGHPKDGKEPYPMLNWRKGISDPKWLRARYGNFMIHAAKLGNGIVDLDDNIEGNADAMIWFCMMLCEALDKHPDAVYDAFYSDPREEGHS